MVTGLILIAGMFLGSLVTGAALLLRNRLQIPNEDTADESDTWKIWDAFRQSPPEPPKDYVVNSIPRNPRSWRLRRREIEAQHNTKQKERDALTRPQNPLKEQSNVSQAR